LKDKWSPSWSLESVCRAIIDLLASPNADSPLNCDCGNLIRCEDFVGYISMAKMYTVEFAKSSS
jgi:peroxin-4